MTDLNSENPTRKPDPMRGGALWCPHHNQWECAKRRKGGGPCHGRAITGIDRCRMHAGERSEIAKAKGEAITAWSALSGQPVVSHTEAVLGMLQMSWLRAHLYARLLQQQFEEAQQQGGNGQGNVTGYGEPGLGPGAGLIGHTHGASPNIGVYVTGETARALTTLEAAERDRVVRYAKTAHDMGIAEAQVRIAEQTGQQLAEVIRRTADALLVSVLGVITDAAVADRVRAAWPNWLSTIVPREIAAVTGGDIDRAIAGTA